MAASHPLTEILQYPCRGPGHAPARNLKTEQRFVRQEPFQSSRMSCGRRNLPLPAFHDSRPQLTGRTCMSVIRQIVLSLVVVLIAAAGWYAYDQGYFSTNQGGRGGPAGAGQASGGAGSRGQAPGGRGGAVLVVTVPVATDDTGIDVRARRYRRGGAGGDDLCAQVAASSPRSPSPRAPRIAKGATLVRLDDSPTSRWCSKRRRSPSTPRSRRSTAPGSSPNRSSVRHGRPDRSPHGTEERRDRSEGGRDDLAKRTIEAPFAGIIGLTGCRHRRSHRLLQGNCHA